MRSLILKGLIDFVSLFRVYVYMFSPCFMSNITTPPRKLRIHYPFLFPRVRITLVQRMGNPTGVPLDKVNADSGYEIGRT